MNREARPSADNLAGSLSRILRVGVAIAATLVCTGTVLLLWAHGNGIADYRAFRGEPGALRGAVGAVRSAWALRPSGIIQLGLLILVATPVARVAGAAIAFAHQRNRLYTAIALIVLSALLFSIAGPEIWATPAIDSNAIHELGSARDGRF